LTAWARTSLGSSDWIVRAENRLLTDKAATNPKESCSILYKRIVRHETDRSGIMPAGFPITGITLLEYARNARREVIVVRT